MSSTLTIATEAFPMFQDLSIWISCKTAELLRSAILIAMAGWK